MPTNKDGVSWRWGNSRQNMRRGPAQPEKITEYPKWVNGRLANNAEEEAELAKLAPPVPPPAPVTKQQAAQTGENPLQAPLNAAYARIQTLEAEIAKRDARIAQLEAPPPPAELVIEHENALAGDDAGKEPEKTVTEDEKDADPTKVEIPENWKEAHHRTRMSLARQISGEQPASAEHADNIIAAEVSRRAK